MSDKILHARLEKSFKNMFISVPDVPDYIQDNISHELREYQKQALRQFIFTQELDEADLAYNYLLFHMATGSGKTLVLASSILYLFKAHGYQNFIFFADSDAIVKKTYDNLTNINSAKYLFNKDGIVIDGNRVDIQVVNMFPVNPSSNTIYLKLTSIQKLHGDLTEPKENGLTYDYLKDFKIVLLADEAHHYFVETKRNKKKITKKEMTQQSWEKTLNELLNLNLSNRVLGFSATFNLTNELIFNKIKDNIVYQYDLKQFMYDKYSKNVVLLRADEKDETKMLHGVLLNQYKKYVAEDNGIDLKPVIMFKSSKIAISEQAYSMLVNIIKDLTPEQLEVVIENGLNVYQNRNSIWHKMFNYYNRKGNFEKIVEDLKWDFTEQNILNVNSQVFLSEENTLMLNSLEDKDNPIRAIFQIAKLNEGWDVLNLFDIVRISEGATSTINTTDSEAQLIGRGARYYPFVYKGKSSYTRRFDKENTELKVIETLHYHTINESTYIKNLNKSLDKAKIQIMEDDFEILEAKVKTNFKKTDIFKQGKIYINKLVPTTVDDYKSLENYHVLTEYEIPLTESIEQVYGEKRQITSTIKKHEMTWKVERTYIQKAIQRNPFFHFNNLKNYVPAVDSIKEFISSPDFLGNLIFYVTLPINMTLNDLTPSQKLNMVDKFFRYMENKIRLNFRKERGTPYFEGVALKEYINDYYIEISKVNANVSHSTEIVKSRSMREHDWYIYDKAIGNGWELNMIDFINDYIDKLEKKYNDVYLIRNERKVKVVEIDGTRGFMPDFLLYMKNEGVTYQVFLEVKGDQLSKEDKWKQDFLLELTKNPNIEVLDENEQVRLIGIKFYSKTDRKKNEFRDDFVEKLL